MIEASYLKAHPHAARAKGKNQAMSRIKESTPLAVDAQALPVRVAVRQGSTAAKDTTLRKSAFPPSFEQTGWIWEQALNRELYLD